MKEVQLKGKIQLLPGYDGTWFAPTQVQKTLYEQD
jgi:hypothetical protein